MKGALRVFEKTFPPKVTEAAEIRREKQEQIIRRFWVLFGGLRWKRVSPPMLVKHYCSKRKEKA